MSPVEQQIIDTWFIHHRTNLMILDTINEEALTMTTSKRGGGTVGHQLAHMYNVRFWKLEKMDKLSVEGLTTVKAEDLKTIAVLKDLHILSAELVGKMLKSGIESGGTIKGFKRGVVPLLGYFIHHEAHHRGNILLSLKLCGFKLPTVLQNGIWEWNKI